MKNASGYTFEEWIKATRVFCLGLLTPQARATLEQEWLADKSPLWGNR